MLLEGLSRKIDESRDDIKNLIKHVSINVVGAPIPRIKKVKTSDIPLNPRREDYINVKYWSQEPWSEVRRGTSTNDTDSPIFSSFMEDEFGNSISKGVKSAVIDDVKGFWTDMYNTTGPPKPFTQTGLTTKENFRTRMEGRYPWLRLCEAHWKVNQLWINYFTTWKPTTTPGGTPTGGKNIPVPVIELETSDSDASIGSKRGREDAEQMIPSKKLKERQIEKPAPRPAQKQPKKSRAKVAKVRSTIISTRRILLKRV